MLYWIILHEVLIYTLIWSRLRQNTHYFANDIFKRISLNENLWISYENSLKHIFQWQLFYKFNSLAPGKFEWNFIYVIFKQILVTDGWGISCEIALIWMFLDVTDDQSTLVQVMAWCRQATSHYLNQCWPRSLSPYGVTRPQWVNSMERKCLPIFAAFLYVHIHNYHSFFNYFPQKWFFLWVSVLLYFLNVFSTTKKSFISHNSPVCNNVLYWIILHKVLLNIWWSSQNAH